MPHNPVLILSIIVVALLASVAQTRADTPSSVQAGLVHACFNNSSGTVCILPPPDLDCGEIIYANLRC